MIFMNRIEAEDFVYKSYLKAEKSQKYDDKDAYKRHPELSFSILQEMSRTPAVVITGSKGKGSVANMVASMLQSQLKVGLMTSPHISDFCERFRCNNIPISDDDFVRHIERVAPVFEKIDQGLPDNVAISPMAIQAAVALSYFNEVGTNFNVFECGKGAKYDDVNNIRHDYAVINSIFLEHTRELGETIEQIAEDKSHVVTVGQKCVFVAEQKPSVLEVIEKRASEMNVPLKVYGKDFFERNVRFTKEGMLFDVVVQGEEYKEILVPLLGEHQARNCALALALVREILGSIDLPSVKGHLRELRWAGRMEILNRDPFVMLDACINRASCDNVKLVLDNLKISKCCTIVGIPSDKDYVGVVQSMSDYSNMIILTKSQNKHYQFSSEQADILRTQGIEVEWSASVGEAIELGKRSGLPIVMLGTTSVIAEIEAYFGR